MNTPGPYHLIILALAAFRTWRLLAHDTILNKPRDRILRDLERNAPAEYRDELRTFLSCPWCLGFWICVAWWGAYQLTEDWTVFLAVPWALSAIVALIAQNLEEKP